MALRKAKSKFFLALITYVNVFQHTSSFSAVVKQVTDLDVAGQLPPEAEIQKMVDDLKNGITSLDLKVHAIY